MPAKKNIKTILRKNKKEEVVRKVPVRKPEPFDIRSFAFLVIALGVAIFVGYKFFTKSDGPDAGKNINVVQAGVNDLNNGNFAEAEKKFQEVLKVEKNNQEAIFRLAIVKYNKKQYEEAIADIEGVLVKNPEYSEGYNILGNIYRDLKKNDEAMKNYRKAIENDLENVSPYANLAIMFMDLNNYEEGMKVVVQGLKNNPDNETLLNLEKIFNK